MSALPASVEGSAARPLVLVHGFLSGSEYWSGVRESLEQGRRVIAIDLPGFGQRHDDTSVDSIAGFAADVLDTLSAMSVTTFDLLGHSMGGMIAQEMAHRAPERVARLILYGTGSEGELPGRFEPIAESRRKVDAQGKSATVSFIVTNWYVGGREDPGFEDALALAERASVAAVKAGLTAMEGWRGTAYLEQHRMPTLVLWGDCDRVYPFSQEMALWQGIPDARLAVIPGAGHNAHHEKPRVFTALVKDFLDTEVADFKQ